VDWYPVYLDLRSRPCVVIGGGELAERKLEGLLAAGARVTVVAPSVGSRVTALAATHEVVHHARSYRSTDLAGVALAFAATDDEALHARIAADAAEAGVPLNVVDRPRLCTFIAPAIVRRGTVSVAVSTGGASPALARHLRQELERLLGSEWGLAAEILGRLRSRLTEAVPDAAARARLFSSLAGPALLDALRARDSARVDRLLAAAAGPEASLAALDVTLADDGSFPA
jgi:precorrin-2 dehydrogenase/sirohydrochlorin ferrochelatase